MKTPVWTAAGVVTVLGLAAGAFAGGNLSASRATTRRGTAPQAATTKQTEAQNRRAEIQSKIQERQSAIQDRVQDRVDQRQEWQSKRIQHGINKGYLTPAEVAKLQAQQTSIANLETAIFADGKLTRTEVASIRTELNEASRCIWAEKHDTEGNQMPAYAFGRNVFAKDEVTAKLANENLSVADAKAVLADFRRMTELKRQLSTANLSDAERAALQAEYDNLLNQYFIVR